MLRTSSPRTFALLSASLLSLALASCGSSGSSGSGGVSGLNAPAQMSVVAPDSGTPFVLPSDVDIITPYGSTFGANSDYVQDTARVWVYDSSMEALGTVNSILCQVGRTAYSEMVNEGVYEAQVDVEACEKANGNGDDDTGQGSGGAASFSVFTAETTRLSNAAAQQTYFWVPGENPGEYIYADLSLTEGASSTNPFGQFSMSFASAANFADLATNPAFFGFLGTLDAASGMIGFQFYESSGDITMAQAPNQRASRTQVVVEMTPDRTTGSAKISSQRRENNGGGDTGIQTEEFKVVFNPTHLKRQEGVNPVATLSRTMFNNRVFRYGLYHNEGPDIGKRVALNSGFGFRTMGGEFGYIGYWGMWTPDGVTVADGDTIFRNTYDGSVEPAFTVVTAPGRLIKNTRQQLDLTEISGRRFDWWDGSDQYRIGYDTGIWYRYQIWNAMNDEFDDIMTPTAIDLNATGGFLGMWSPEFNGPVNFVDGNSYITFFEQEFVNGSSDLLLGASGGYVQLFGLANCLDAAINQTDLDNGDVFLTDAPSVGSAHVYRFGEDDLTLYYDVNGDLSSLGVVGPDPAITSTTGPFDWGMRSGPLVTSTAGLTNVEDIWDVTEYYVYETGFQDYNKLVSVKDANDAFVNFDRPIQFLYTHATANDRNGDATYDGRAYVLSYFGDGDLGGLPNEGVDLDGDMSDDRYYPVFGLSDGVTVGPSTGTEYVVKALEIERTLSDDPGAAPGLDITTADALVLPDDTLYTTPSNEEKPTIQGAPRVIDGEVVE